MAAPKLTLLAVHGVRLAIYDFAAAGDILPMHVHDAATAHVTLIQRGSVIVRTPDKSETFSAPDILATHPGEPHEFEAVEAWTRVTNVTRDV
jgi:quercetin dioxygenase-like cupin family protein